MRAEYKFRMFEDRVLRNKLWLTGAEYQETGDTK